MGGEEQGATLPVHRGQQVIQALDPDTAECVLQRPDEERRQLGDHDAEVPVRRAADPAMPGDVHLGERAAEVRQGGPAAAGGQGVAEIAQALADPARGVGRKPPDRRGQRTERSVDGAACLRRSRRISTAMGIRDSTMTTTTTTWMWRSMFGTTLPSRYPAQVMLTTHPMPPTTL